jgi:hypothetical protein
MLRPSGERSSMIDSMSLNPAIPADASVRTGPAEMAFTRIDAGPSSYAR